MIAGANDVAGRMKNIMQIFSEAQSISAETTDFTGLADRLDGFEIEFRSVAYEAASMVITLEGFENDPSLGRWHAFRNTIAKEHTSQVYTGMGWAFARLHMTPKNIPGLHDPLMHARVLDGYGYYEGIFRLRASVLCQMIPEGLTDSLYGYDQGLGRAIYYHCKGETEKVSEMISSFPEKRQADLWRGVGIACVYVGGCDEKMLRNLFSAASANHPQLFVGAAMVARARIDSSPLTSDVESACNTWCNCSAYDAILVTLKADETIALDNDAYKNWVQTIAEELSLISSNKT